ncbi:hypothetical protein DLREEDagrD3_18730 [Denitratisoma sp. agr-D3]
MLARLRRGYGQWIMSGGQLLLVMLGVQLDTPQGWRACALLIAALSLLAWVSLLRRLRAVADTPTARIASAAQGYAELRGRGVALAGTPLFSPLRSQPCLWYRYEVERRQDDKWVNESGGESDASFLVDDGSGLCLVDPAGAEILTAQADRWQEGDHRYRQWLILPGETVTVLGEFRTWSGATLDLDAAEDVKHLLAEWKNDMPALLRRYDLDGDGELGLDEWELVRAQARREVERNHRELRATPDSHGMAAPADGRLYLISTLAESQLLGRYRRWALFQLLMFGAALYALIRIKAGA